MTRHERFKVTIVERLPERADSGFADALAEAFRAHRRPTPPAPGSDVDVPAASASQPTDDGGMAAVVAVDLASGRTATTTAATTTQKRAGT